MYVALYITGTVRYASDRAPDQLHGEHILGHGRALAHRTSLVVHRTSYTKSLFLKIEKKQTNEDVHVENIGVCGF